MRFDHRLMARQDAAPVGEGDLAAWMVDSCQPVVREEAGLFVDDAVGESRRWRRTVHTQNSVDRHVLVPPRQDERREVGVVVEVVMGEKHGVDLGGRNSGLHQLVGRGRAAIEKQFLAADLNHVGRAKAVGCRRGSAAADDGDLRSLGHCYIAPSD